MLLSALVPVAFASADLTTPSRRLVASALQDGLCDLHSDIWNGFAKTLLPEGELDHVWFNGSSPASRVLLSAPHAHETFRYGDPEDIHDGEVRLGAIAELLHNLTGVPVIRKNYKSDDPAYYNRIPENSQTPGWENRAGEIVPYKASLAEYLHLNPNIYVVLDLHGASGDVEKWQPTTKCPTCTGEVPAIDLGTGPDDASLTDNASFGRTRGADVKAAILDTFADAGLSAVNNMRFSATYSDTITKWVSHEHTDPETIGRIALQFEITSDYRSCSSSNEQNVIDFVTAMVSTVERINAIFEDDWEKCTETPKNCDAYEGWPVDGRAVNCAGRGTNELPCTTCAEGYFLRDDQTCDKCEKPSRCKSAKTACYKETDERDCTKCKFGWFLKGNDCKFLGRW